MKPSEAFPPDVYIEMASHTNTLQDHQAVVLPHLYTGLDVWMQ